MKIVFDLPSADEAIALAQLTKRFTHDDAVRFSNRHDSGRERNAMLEGVVGSAARSRRSRLLPEMTSGRASLGARLFHRPDSAQHMHAADGPSPARREAHVPEGIPSPPTRRCRRCCAASPISCGRSTVTVTTMPERAPTPRRDRCNATRPSSNRRSTRPSTRWCSCIR
jgi:hypothetical protein